MLNWLRNGSLVVLAIGLAGCNEPIGAGGFAEPGTSQPAAPNDAAALSQGEQALIAGDIDAARRAFQNVLRARPSDPGAALGMAQTYIATNQFDTARRFVALAGPASNEQDRAALSFVLGQLARQDGDLLEAIRRFRESLAQRPGFWRAWLALGRVHTKQGKFAEAREAFTAAGEFASGHAAVSNDIGMSYIAEKKPSEAIRHFEAALARDPAHKTAQANLRIARAMLGEYDAAVSGATPGELADTLNNVGYIAVMNGDFEVAGNLLRRAVDVSPTYHEAASANLDLLAQVRSRRVATVPSGTPSVAAASNYRDLTPPDLAQPQVTASPDGAADAHREIVVAALPGPAAPANKEHAFNWQAELKPPVAPAQVEQRPASIEALARPAGGEAQFRWESPPQRQADIQPATARPGAPSKQPDALATLAVQRQPEALRDEALPSPPANLSDRSQPSAVRTSRSEGLAIGAVHPVPSAPAPVATKPAGPKLAHPF